jgi:tight adherence protein B
VSAGGVDVTGATVVVAALLVGAAAAIPAPVHAAGQRLRSLGTEQTSTGAGSRSSRIGGRAGSRLAGSRVWVRVRRLVGTGGGPLAGLLAGLVAGLVGVLVAGPVGGCAATAYAIAGHWAWRRSRRRRSEEAEQAAGAAALAGLADDLRAGRPPLTALRTALTDLAARHGQGSGVDSALVAMRDAVMAGADPTDVLRGDAGALAPALRKLAATWALTDLGVPLADVVDRLDAELRAAGRSRERIAAHTAAARTTAWLVAALPPVGLAMGQGMGADPLRVLATTPIGACCTFGAVALHLAGFAWAGRLGRPRRAGA